MALEQSYKRHQSNFLNGSMEKGMKANQDKRYFLLSLGESTKLLLFCILESSGSQKLLGVEIAQKLNFNEHVTNLCDKTRKRIQGRTRNFPYIPQFGYCPLV